MRPLPTSLIDMSQRFVIRRQRLMKEKELYPNAIVGIPSIFQDSDLIRAGCTRALVHPPRMMTLRSGSQLSEQSS